MGSELYLVHHPGPEPFISEVFNSHIRENFKQVPREVGDIDSEWIMLSLLLCGAVSQGLWSLRGGNTRTRWWTVEVRDGFKLSVVAGLWDSRGS